VVGSLALVAVSAWYSILVANEERLSNFKSHMPVEGFDEHPFFFLWNFGLIIWAGMTSLRTMNYQRASSLLSRFQQHLFHLPGVVGMTVMGVEFTWALVPQLDPWFALIWILPTAILLAAYANATRDPLQFGTIKNALPIISEVLMIAYSMGLCILGFGRKRPLTSIATMILLAAHEMQKNVMEGKNFVTVMLCLSLSNVLYAVALSSGAYDCFSDAQFWDTLFNWDKMSALLFP
jgi:hypothetical protein